MRQLHCPVCGLPLERQESERGNHWECVRCNGKAATTAFLRKIAGSEAVSNLWLRARVADGTGHRQCPSCSKKMKEVTLETDHGPVELDVCTQCSMVWFDYSEFEKTIREQERPESIETGGQGDHAPGELPMAARKMLAMKQVEAIARHSRQKDMFDFNQAPDHWWQWVLGFFGVPIEQDGPRLSKIPIATWSLAAIIVALNVGIFLQGSQYMEEVFKQWGLIPNEIFRYGGLTMITSFFLHGDPFHLIGNMYFFLVVGDNVEDDLGIGPYLLLLFGATIIGDVLHSLVMHSSGVPCIGASGGISGLILFYVLRFPRTKFCFLFRFYWHFHWIRVPVFLWALFWVGMQLVLVYLQVSGSSNVSALGHMGGALVGLGAFLFLRYWSPSRQGSQVSY